MLAFISSTAFGLAVVLVATAGLFATIGADRIRDALLRAAAAGVVMALGAQVVAGTLSRLPSLRSFAPGHPDLDALLLAMIVLGHVSLAIFLYRRRAGSERTGFAADLEAARGRERVRLVPPIAREDVR